MGIPELPRPELSAAERFAALGQQAPAKFSVDFLPNNFFNPSRTNTDFRNTTEGGHEHVLSAKTPPEVLAREVFRSMGVIPDETVQSYLKQQATVLTRAVKLGQERAVQQLVASNAPRNAVVRQGFDALQNFLDSRFGMIYDHLGLQATTFGNFVVAQSVMDIESSSELIIDLRASEQNKVS